MMKNNTKEVSESDKLLFRDAELLYSKHELGNALRKYEQIRDKDEIVCCRLALLYSEFKSLRKAEKYYLMAVEKGHLGAMNNLAVLYKNEFKSYDKAKKYYLMAFQNGFVGAMFNLARLYQNELDSAEKAKKCYLIAVQEGHIGAIFNLALLYHKDSAFHNMAEKYYLMAVEKGHVKAMLNLAMLYEGDSFKAWDKAEKYYRMAAENGDVKAMVNLGQLYEKDAFQDGGKAEKYYLMAVEKKHTSAMYNLALLYHRELGLYQKAEEYYLMAVKKGHARAMFNLALLYEEEDFISYEKAEKYYFRAIEKDITDAMNNLAWLYFTQKKEKGKALELARKAFEKDRNFIHMHTLADILLWHGQIEKAVQLFGEIVSKQEASEQDQEDIQIFLLLLIAKRQYRFAMEFFRDTTLRFTEQYELIYYALIYLMQGQYPPMVKDMGKGMKETLREILSNIEQLSRDYA